MNAESLIDREAASRASDPCLVYGNPAAELLYPLTYRGSVDEASVYFLAHRTATAHGTIVRCRDCGFVFTSPRFSGSDYDRIYMAVRPPPNLDPSFETAKAARFHQLTTIVRKFQPRDVPFLDFGCGDGGSSAGSTVPPGAASKLGRRAGGGPGRARSLLEIGRRLRVHLSSRPPRLTSWLPSTCSSICHELKRMSH